MREAAEALKGLPLPLTTGVHLERVNSYPVAHIREKEMTKFIALALVLLFGSAQAQSLQGRDFNGDGTADGYFDTAQNITWLADANYYVTTGGAPNTNPYTQSNLGPGQVRLINALPWLATLNLGGVSGWRLPQRFIQQGSLDPDNQYCNLTSCMPGLNWPSELSFLATALGGSTGPFGNIQPGDYMAYDRTGNHQYVQLINPLSGYSDITDETGLVWGYVWAVHDGAVGAPVTPVPEPSTYALMLVGLAAATARWWRRSPAVA